MPGDDQPSFSTFSARAASRLFLGLLGALLVLIGCTFRDYGITWDEHIQSRYGDTLLRWYATLGRNDLAVHFGNLYLYGGFFETLAEGLVRLSPLGQFDTRHLVGACFGVLAFPAVFATGLRLGGALAGLLGAILLGLAPLFYGHIFANCKDAPFAVAFMVALFLMVDSVAELRSARGPRFVLLGLAIGISAGIRVWGLALLGWLALLWGATLLSWSQQGAAPAARRDWQRAFGWFGAVTLVAWITMLLAWPWACLSPVLGPLRALKATATLRPDLSFLFRGEIVSAAALPRDYAFTWFVISLPEVHLISLCLGLALAMRWLVRGRWEGSSRFAGPALPLVWLAAVAFAPLFLVALARPFLYDGVRHLLFVVPPLCVLMGVALAELAHSSARPLVKAVIFIPCFAFGLSTVADMVALHPYQTVFFNRVFGGGLPLAAARYETDYWGSTYKEGVEWLARNYAPPSRRPVRLALIGASRQLTYYLERIENGNRFEVRESDEAPHVLLITRVDNRFKRIKGTLLHTVVRQGTPLLFIFEIRRPGSPENR